MGSLYKEFQYKELLGALEVSSTDIIPAGFCSQKLWGLIFLVLEPWAGGPGMALGLLAPEISLSVPLLPVWMDVVSLIL